MLNSPPLVLFLKSWGHCVLIYIMWLQHIITKLPISDIEKKCFCPRWFTASYSPGFKWFGSLTNLSTSRSSQKGKLKAAPEHDGSLADARSAAVESQSVDDMESCSHSSSYVCSSHMYTHVGTVPRSEKLKKSFRGQKKKKGEEEEGVSGGQSQRKEEDHVRESPLLSALASLSQTSLDRPQPTTPKPSRDSPLTSAPESGFRDALRDRSKDDTDSSVRNRSNMATNGPKVAPVQDVYVPMDRIVKVGHSQVDEQVGLQEDTGTQETSRTVNRSQEVVNGVRWECLTLWWSQKYSVCLSNITHIVSNQRFGHWTSNCIYNV